MLWHGRFPGEPSHGLLDVAMGVSRAYEPGSMRHVHYPGELAAL